MHLKLPRYHYSLLILVLCLWEHLFWSSSVQGLADKLDVTKTHSLEGTHLNILSHDGKFSKSKVVLKGTQMRELVYMRV